MKQLSFLRHGMVIHASNVEGNHNHGDPLPVEMVKAGLHEWKKQNGWTDDSYVAPEKRWDMVRIGSQTFSAKQYLLALKSQAAQNRLNGDGNQNAAPSSLNAEKTEYKNEGTKRLSLKAPDHIPDWGLAPDEPRQSSTFGATPLSSAKSIFNEKAAGPVFTEDGQIDFYASQDKKPDILTRHEYHSHKPKSF